MLDNKVKVKRHGTLVILQVRVGCLLLPCAFSVEPQGELSSQVTTAASFIYPTALVQPR